MGWVKRVDDGVQEREWRAWAPMTGVVEPSCTAVSCINFLLGEQGEEFACGTCEPSEEGDAAHTCVCDVKSGDAW